MKINELNKLFREAFSKSVENFKPNYYVTKAEKTKEGIDTRIVTFSDEHTRIAEQYKVLRTNLYTLSSSTETPLKTFLITSSVAGEGKGISASNIAYCISLEKEKRVLLLDADLRKPTIHQLFGLPRSPGFSDFLTDNIDIDYLLKRPAIENLYVITTGGSIRNPTETLNKTKLSDLFNKIKTKFDYIIIDSPPVINVTDTLILAPLCDAVILIVKADSTPRKFVTESFDLLKNSQAKPKACILTNVSIPIHPYYRHYYKRIYENKVGS